MHFSLFIIGALTWKNVARVQTKVHLWAPNDVVTHYSRNTVFCPPLSMIHNGAALQPASETINQQRKCVINGGLTARKNPAAAIVSGTAQLQKKTYA